MGGVVSQDRLANARAIRVHEIAQPPRTAHIKTEPRQVNTEPRPSGSGGSTLLIRFLTGAARLKRADYRVWTGRRPGSVRRAVTVLSLSTRWALARSFTLMTTKAPPLLPLWELSAQ